MTVKKGERKIWKQEGRPAEGLPKIRQDGRNIGFEFKLTRSPKVTPSMRSAREALGLDELYVVCHGAGEPWPMAEGIFALPAMCLGIQHWQHDLMMNCLLV